MSEPIDYTCFRITISNLIMKMIERTASIIFI